MDEKKKIRGVIIDAGHGGRDPGAVAGKLREKDFTLKASLYMRDRLKQLGIPVKMTRETDETLSNQERVRRARNAFGLHEDVLLISNHINTGGGEGQSVTHSV